MTAARRMQHLGRVGLLADLGRELGAARDRRVSAAPSARAALLQRARGADDHACTAQDAAREARSVARKLDVRAPELHEERLSVAIATAPDGSQWACTRSASRLARRAARAKFARNAGTSAARQGCRLRLPMTPAP